jgi:glucokinase
VIVLACDFGGTRIKIGVVSNGRVLAKTVRAARSKQGLAPQLPVLRATWLELLARSGLKPRDCAGIGVAFPSLVNNASGRVLAEYGKYRDAPELDLRRWAASEFDLPLAIENDARMALIGEWQAGAGRGCDNLVMMTLGTGLGTAVLMEGTLLQGRHGQAGVLGGHLTVRYGGQPCSCGNLGCAEAEASTAFLGGLASRTPGFESSPLSHAATLNYAVVFKLAAAGDPSALALREHSLRVWGALAVNLIHAYDPDRLIVGGGIMAGADVVLPALRNHVERYAHTPWGKVEVVAGQLGDRSALLAAEWLVGEYLAKGGR